MLPKVAERRPLGGSVVAPDRAGELLARGTALWGARHPGQLQPVDDVCGWSIDASAKAEIDRILRDLIRAPIGPEFMAPPARP
jgi:hypothetical protein